MYSSDQEIVMKRSKKALLIGLTIGDGCITKDSRGGRTATLELHHSTKQLKYLRYKNDLLHSALGGKKPEIRFRTQIGKNGSEYNLCRIRKTHKYFNVLRRWIYPNKYNQDILKYLDAQALAIWFMDDGAHIAAGTRKDGSRTSENRLFLCTSKENAEGVIKYFKDTWGINWRLYKHRGYYSIRCGHKEGAKFHKLIHPYIIPSMAYKQRFYYDTSA